MQSMKRNQCSEFEDDGSHEAGNVNDLQEIREARCFSKKLDISVLTVLNSQATGFPSNVMSSEMDVCHRQASRQDPGSNTLIDFSFETSCAENEATPC